MPSIQDIDADYLSQALGSLVESFQVESIGAGDGYMSDLYRITLQSDALPESVILKLPAADAQKHELASRYGSYQREQDFYRDLAARTAVRTPRCYFNAENEFLLLLEDAKPWPVTDVTSGASRHESVVAITHLAKLQAGFWSTAPEAAAPFSAGFEAAARDMTTFGLDRLAELPSTASVQLLQHYARDPMAHLPLFTSQKQVFSHMDFRLDNMRIEGDELMLFDWGDCSLAPVGFDLAYFLITSISSENRRAWEETLVSTYQRCLASNGVQYDQETLFDSYRLALLPGFYIAALVLTSGHHDYGMLLAERCLAAVADHKEFAMERFGA